MKLELNITRTENLTDFSQSDLREIEQIVTALVESGGLTGVRGGKTIIHFDAGGNFQRVQLDYFPWVRRKS